MSEPSSRPGTVDVDRSASYVVPRGPGQSDAWTEAFGLRGSQHLREVATAVPPSEVRELLGLATGEAAIVRRRTIALDRRPVELADSWYPKRVAAGTGLELMKKIRGGAPTLLAELGYVAAATVEDICAPVATDEQADELFVPYQSRVLELARASYDASGAPFEVSVMTMNPELPDGELRHLRYELKLI